MIDAHVHLWDLALDPQPWIDPVTMAQIHRDFGLGDLGAMADRCSIDAAVVVQASNSAPETARLLTLDTPRVAGVVGWLDLTRDVDEQLAALSHEQRARLVGVRHLVHLDPDPDWLDRDAVTRGLARLGAQRLGFDLVLRPEQLAGAARAARRCPGTGFVLDHLGGVADAEDLAGWERGLREIGRLPNVFAKISGLASLARDAGRITRPIATAVEVFGPARLMYGSDWPLTRLGIGAPAWRAAVDAELQGLDDASRRRIAGGTAAEYYRLGVA